MPKDRYTSGDLEVLVATMKRTNLDFLYAMFKKNDIARHSVLIINQTQEDAILESTLPNVRVINSSESGLSNSRNTAIKNAEKPYCLIADDDVIFMEGFAQKILKAFDAFENSIITFKTLTTDGKPYWEYPEKAKQHNYFLRKRTLSIEIAFRRDVLIENTLFFDTRFGLGAQFQDAENYVFLNDANKKGIVPLFFPEYVTVHPPTSSSDALESDRSLYAKTAVRAHVIGNLSYLWVFKFVSFLVRKKYISFSEASRKIKLGFKSISDYKKTIQ